MDPVRAERQQPQYFAPGRVQSSTFPDIAVRVRRDAVASGGGFDSLFAPARESFKTEAMSDPKPAYRVLARKYRPRNFGELIGQDALVRTLTNAINSGRIAQAYMLTGVRGVGKTTTARIIARALNYTGPDGKAGPTTGPTDDCDICRAIAEDRHPDVMEMDAASRTGVDDIRELIDGVRYAPASARYKVYIIDEVHMLSKNAFNALLKTLEEPPPHVIFIFATTEIRKVPITVLSRCQRFDLRRVDVPTLSAYYGTICARETVTAEDEALALIARAADGSVRDGLSLLDQAIARGGSGITAEQVQDMLGLADRGQIFDMLDQALRGDCAAALGIAGDLYRKGADPSVVIEDMLDLTHLMTRLRVAPTAAGLQGSVSQAMVDRAGALAATLSVPTLGRAWQILLKGVAEVQHAPNPQSAAEMVLIRLSYAADLPDPADLLKKLRNAPATDAVIPASDTRPSVPASAQAAMARMPDQPPMRQAVGGENFHSVAPEQALAAPETMLYPSDRITSLGDIAMLLQQAREMVLHGQLFYHVHPVRIEPGKLEIRITDGAQPDFTQNLRKFLMERTDRQWFIGISSAAGGPTLAQLQAKADDELLAQANADPTVRSVLEIFPGAKLRVVKNG